MGKTEDDRQISEAAEARVCRRRRRKTESTGHDSRNFRFGIHAPCLLRRQAHHRRSRRPDHPGAAATWRLFQSHFEVMKRTGSAGALAKQATAVALYRDARARLKARQPTRFFDIPRPPTDRIVMKGETIAARWLGTPLVRQETWIWPRCSLRKKSFKNSFMRQNKWWNTKRSNS